MMGALVSVIITTCRRDSETVLRAVGSVREQSFREFEIIVVDDSPEDDRRRLCVEEALMQLSDDRIRYVPHEKNMGACAARNTGIRESRGDYVCFLDDDDEYLPEKLERQVRSLTSDSGAGLSLCDFYVRTFGKEASGSDGFSQREVNLPYSEENIYHQIFMGNKIATPNPLIRRECLDECGGFDESMPSAQDMELWIRLLSRYRAVIVREPLYIQNVHCGERISRNYEKKLRGNELLIEKNLDYLKLHAKAHSYLVMVQAKRHIQMGDKKEMSAYLRAVKIYPAGIPKYLAMLLYWERKYGKHR